MLGYSIISNQQYNQIVQLQMTDNPKTNPKWNMFSLIRLKPECRISPTFVDFTPLFSTPASNGSILPVFNDDRCYYTPCFLLSSEKKTQAKNKKTQQIEFEQRVRMSVSSLISEKTPDLVPSSNYCQICHSYFKNYDQHLEQKSHMIRSHHNEFNLDIQQLCSLVEESENSSSPCGKRKKIKKRDSEIHAIKSSPKTTVDNYPKRKMSLSYQQVSFSGQQLKDSFNL